MKSVPVAAAIKARAPRATPTPMPILAPWERPVFGVGVLVAVVDDWDGVDVEDGVGVGSEVALLLPPLGLVFVWEGFPVAWLHVTGFWLLSMTTLKFPLRA